ncbi:MAG: hypothetical protein HZA03_01125 [Nitrospinae bacterium]|nr:hypothetical protein [Nitrospinota bacterium]
MASGRAERETASSHDPLLGHLRKMRLICPFAVSPAKYGARQELSVSCFCWFMAEQHRAGLADDVGCQILAACVNPGAYAGCAIYGAVREV